MHISETLFPLKKQSENFNIKASATQRLCGVFVVIINRSRLTCRW